MSTQKNNANKEADLNTEDLSEVTNSVGGASDAVDTDDDQIEVDYLPSSIPDKDTFERFYQTYEKPMMPYAAIQQQVVNKSGSVENVKAIVSSVFDRHYAPLVGPLTRITEVKKSNCLATRKELLRVSKELANTPQFLNDDVEKKPFTPGDWIMLVIPAVALAILVILSPLTMKAHFEGTHSPLFTNHPFLTYGMGAILLIAGMVGEVLLHIVTSNRFKKLLLVLILIPFAFAFGNFILGLGVMTVRNGLTAEQKLAIAPEESVSELMRGGNLTQKWILFELSAGALSLSCVILMLTKRYHSGKIKNPHHGNVKRDLDKLHVDFHDRANQHGSAEGRLQMIQHERDLFISEGITIYHYGLQERA
ncbi:MAG: hypothetical protein EAZ42_01540 [Verrucomicrobia bacterium]|nr:MAG: hypothetical protein EAZ42_01540 [Verrucomicrobiota bacterium]